jgi:TetR/AcrR family transcriptional regulator, repressor for neighboring sulfatase
MGSPRGDSAVTRQSILAAARELFAAHGVDGVSVRDIAGTAGVNHALVHRYFGTKDEMVAAILLAEGERMSSMGRPEADPRTSLEAMREVLMHALSEGRTSLLLMLRAEIDGLQPERMLEGSPLRPLVLLRAWIEEHVPPEAEVDAQALTMVVGAAMMGLVSCRPMLASGAGAREPDEEALLHRCVDALIAIVANAVGEGPQALGAGSARLGDGEDR